MQIKGLYAIVDNTFSPQYPHEKLAHLMLLGGCKLIQLRMKNVRAEGLWSDSVFETARKIMALKKDFDFNFIVNDFVDVAGEVGADGIHVGANDLPIPDVRKRLGKKLVVGYSSHSINEAIAAQKLGADYIAFGAIFPTKTKGPGYPIQGIEKLKALRGKISNPIVAIGGINRSNIEDVMLSGADAAAMITSITQAKDIVTEIKWYVEKCRSY